MTVVHRDKKMIRLISNVHGRGVLEGGRPVVLRDYNNWARGVDLSNQMIANDHYDHRSVKWYKTSAISFLETSVANAYCLYKLRHVFNAKKHLAFREELVSELLQDYMVSVNANIRNQPTNRIIPGMHRIGILEQKSCVICSSRENKASPKYYCIDCDKNVCVVNCFYRLHANLQIYVRNKWRNLQD